MDAGGGGEAEIARRGPRHPQLEGDCRGPRGRPHGDRRRAALQHSNRKAQEELRAVCAQRRDAASVRDDHRGSGGPRRGDEGDPHGGGRAARGAEGAGEDGERQQ